MAAIDIRPLESADWPAAGAFVAQRAELAMPLLAQLQRPNADQPDHALGAYQKGKLVGLLVLGGNGLVHLQCPDKKLLTKLLASWANDFEGACLGLAGPRDQIDHTLGLFGGEELPFQINNIEQVLVRDLAAAQPELPPGIVVRPAFPAELDMLCGWRTAFFHEVMNMPLSADLVAMTNYELQQLNPQGRLLVLEHAGLAVAMGQIVAELAGTAQFGAVYVSPELRYRGYATLLLAGIGQTAQQRGQGKAIVYSTQRCAGLNRAAAKLGYTAAGDIGMVLFAEPVTPPQLKAA
jgi:GNAT superfamily N-acetyltransferase